jgi:formamidopyrimidine-DNA glycosylase
MPELPEVQTTVNGINKYTTGLSILDVWTDYGSLQYEGKNHIKNKLFFKKFKKAIVGAKISKAKRRAKNVLIELSNGKTILIHMKMTGHVMYGKYKKTARDKDPWEPILKTGPLRDPFNKYIRFVISFSNGKHLVLSDMRRFAKVTLIPTNELFQSDDLSAIGPEPLEKSFTSKLLEERLKTKPNGKIKTVLMDQSVVAGIGNIYSDEILWASDIHPLAKVSRLKPKDFQKIWKNTKRILRKGIDFGGDSMSDYRNLEGEPGKFQLHHNAYRRTGKPCLKRGCKGTIHRLKVGGRSAHFCPVHQKIL